MEAARLCVLEKLVDDARLDRIGGVHDRLGAIRDNDAEHPVVELPRDFARLDRRLCALRPARIDEPVARYVRREDPRPELATPAMLVGLEQRHPARVDVDLLAGFAVGDRDRWTTLTEAELGDREPMQRRVRHVDAAPVQQSPDLREPDPGRDQLLDRVMLGLAA